MKNLPEKDSVVDLLENKVVLIKPKDGETKVTGFENITDAEEHCTCRRGCTGWTVFP